MRRIALFLFLLAVSVSFGIAQDKSTKPKGDGPLVPLPQNAPAPPDNPTTPEKVSLGKQLFFDPRCRATTT